MRYAIRGRRVPALGMLFIPRPRSLPRQGEVPCDVVHGTPCPNKATHYDVWFSGDIRYFCTPCSKQWKRQDNLHWLYAIKGDTEVPRSLNVELGSRPLPRKRRTRDADEADDQSLRGAP